MLIVNQNPDLGGGLLGWASCFSACTAMQIAIETGGAKQPTAAQVRGCTLNADGSLDVLGGTRASQNIDAAQRCWGVVLDGRVMDFEETWRLGQRVDYAISFSISYAVVSGTQFDGSPGFRGYHQVILSGGKVYDPLADGRRPGIPAGPQRWPKDLLRRAAGRYAAIGLGRAAVVVASEPAIKPRRYSVLFEPGAIFVYADSGLKWTRDQDAGVSKRTSAPSSPPFNVAWGSGRKRLVTIMAGRFAGKSVEPTATHLALRSFAA